MTKYNQMPERIYAYIYVGYEYNENLWREIDGSPDDDDVEYIRADTIAAKDHALDVALETLEYIKENHYHDHPCEYLDKAIAQIEAVKNV